MLRDMLILRLANATNYEVSDEQAIRLNTLWSRTGKDWSYADLWLAYGGITRPMGVTCHDYRDHQLRIPRCSSDVL